MNIDIVGEKDQLPEGFISTINSIFSSLKSKENLTGDFEVTLSIVTDEDIQQLNNKYRKKDEPTDVLSFPLYTREELQNIPQDFPVSLGDIIISLDRANSQAKEYNHSSLREFSFLALHGLLHLLGYDHDTPKNEAEMFSYQNNLLKEYGLER